MCQAPIGRVVSSTRDRIVVDYKGETRELRSKLLDVKPGDYVIFSLDIAIDKMDKEEAELSMG
jgi:hydrogenase maturation factor